MHRGQIGWKQRRRKLSKKRTLNANRGKYILRKYGNMHYAELAYGGMDALGLGARLSCCSFLRLTCSNSCMGGKRRASLAEDGTGILPTFVRSCYHSVASSRAYV